MDYRFESLSQARGRAIWTTGVLGLLLFTGIGLLFWRVPSSARDVEFMDFADAGFQGDAEANQPSSGDPKGEKTRGEVTAVSPPVPVVVPPTQPLREAPAKETDSASDVSEYPTKVLTEPPPKPTGDSSKSGVVVLPLPQPESAKGYRGHWREEARRRGIFTLDAVQAVREGLPRLFIGHGDLSGQPLLERIQEIKDFWGELDVVAPDAASLSSADRLKIQVESLFPLKAHWTYEPVSFRRYDSRYYKIRNRGSETMQKTLETIFEGRYYGNPKKVHWLGLLPLELAAYLITKQLTVLEAFERETSIPRAEVAAVYGRHILTKSKKGEPICPFIIERFAVVKKTGKPGSPPQAKDSSVSHLDPEGHFLTRAVQSGHSRTGNVY